MKCSGRKYLNDKYWNWDSGNSKSEPCTPREPGWLLEQDSYLALWLSMYRDGGLFILGILFVYHSKGHHSCIHSFNKYLLCIHSVPWMRSAQWSQFNVHLFPHLENGLERKSDEKATIRQRQTPEQTEMEKCAFEFKSCLKFFSALKGVNKVVELQ